MKNFNFLISRNYSQPTLWIMILSLGILLSAGRTASAQTKTWTGNVNSEWILNNNWSPAGAPSGNHDVIIPNTTNDPVCSILGAAKSVTVESGGNLTVTGSLVINGSSGHGLETIGNVTISSTGTLIIDNTANHGIYNEDDFNNNGNIIIGGNASVGGYGIFNKFNFDNDGVIIIDDCNSGGIRNQSTNGFGDFTNDGTITIGENANPGNYGIVNYYEFNNNGDINIDDSNTYGISNENVAFFTNEGTITLGANANVGSRGINNRNTFDNTNTGQINIDRASVGIYSFNFAEFTNQGNITIGAINIGAHGIQNQATFENIDNGEIHIDNSNTNAIFNDAFGTFTNKATITIGANASIGSQGIKNLSTFDNIQNGEIYIDNSSTNGILNESGTFPNEADLTIGANTSVGSRGIRNLGTFKNINGGNLSIDNVTERGIWNLSGATFTNKADIDIGANSSIGDYGIFNSGTFSNTNNGLINIDNSAINGVHIYAGTFTNSANIMIGGNTNIGTYGIHNLSNFNNNSGGEVNIDRSTISGILNAGSSASITNAGTITIGANTNIGDYGIHNQNTFTSNTNGLIHIDNSNTYGIYNHNANAFDNNGTIHIGANNPIGERGIYCNSADFNNNANGEIYIDNASSHGITTLLSTFNNAGVITIGANSTIGTYGIQSNGDFNNLSGGEINIDNTGSRGIFCVGGFFTNEATITIGANASVGEYGIYSNIFFYNNSGGEINIDQSTISGINVAQSGFTNEATINIGANFEIGNHGILNQDDFYNNTDGEINIDRSTTSGILNEGTNATFTNEATITIGANANVGDYGIHNKNTFTNNSDGVINIDHSIGRGIYNEEGTFTNAANITMGAYAGVGVFSIRNEATFDNNVGGVINLDNSTKSGIFNDDLSTFTNSDSLIIGANISTGSHGIWNKGTFDNNVGGVINIDNSNIIGIWSFAGTFTNNADITIGANSNVGLFGIKVEATFNNINGQINIDGSTNNAISILDNTFTNSAIINIGANASVGNYGIRIGDTFDNNGTLSITNATNQSIFNDGGTFSNTGMLEGTGTFNLNGDHLDGTLAPGLSPGTMSYTGNQTFTSVNTLEIEVDGTTPNTQHDVIEVAQTATISGTLNVTINYTPSIQDQITFLEANALSGTFSSDNLPQDWSLIYNFPNTGELSLYYDTKNAWIGNESSDWHDPANWSRNAVPDVNTDVRIRQATYDPIISDYATAKTILIHKGVSLTLVSGSTLDVSSTGDNAIYNQGTITNNGSISLTDADDGLVNSGTIQNNGNLNINNIVLGITNVGTFNNNSEGLVDISNSTNEGIHNNGLGIFTNIGNIVISNSGTGIFNYKTFNNNNGGVINIDNTNSNGIYNPGGSFTNESTINISNTNGHGLQNSSNFINNLGGDIEISNTDASYDGIYNNSISANFDNYAQITISNTNNGISQYWGGDFSNHATGEIYIDNTSSSGILHNSPSFNNSGSIHIGATASIGAYGIQNQNTFNNNADGVINIDNTADDGIIHESGTFTNAAAINIGQNGGAGNISGNGIDNHATFDNNNGGVINLDNTASDGIFNENGTFTNAADIHIGQSGGAGNISGKGIDNRAIFNNNSGGVINIDNTGGVGFYNRDAAVQNFSELYIGQNGGTNNISKIGIKNIIGTFNNNTGGVINIDNTGSDGFYNELGDIQNFSELYIGKNGGSGNISGHGIHQLYFGYFYNENGGVLEIDNTVSNGIRNHVCHFINKSGAVINIGQNGGVGNISGRGISNSSESNFKNGTGGTIDIDNTGSYGIYNSWDFSNRGVIDIDNTGGDGFYNYDDGAFNNFSELHIGQNGGAGNISGAGFNNNIGEFLNKPGGVLNIDNTSNDGINNLSGIFKNNDRINIGQNGGSGNITGNGINNQSSSTFFNNNGGVIEIDNTDSSGIRNYDDCIFTNKFGAVLKIGQNGGVGNISSIGIQNVLASFFYNKKTGIIDIDNTVSYGIYNRDSSVFNNIGPIDIDNIGDIGFYNHDATAIFENFSKLNIGQNGGTGNISDVGFYNQNGSIDNETGGEINIDNTSNDGIINLSGSFTNNASINIGQNGGANNIFGDGIDNQATFDNINDGVINIDNIADRGIYNVSNTFTNAATLNIGQNGGAANTESGIVNLSTFNNDSGGVINIDNTGNEAIYNKAGTFTNSSDLTIGQNGGPGNISGIGIENLVTFNNSGTGVILITNTNDQSIYSGGTFINTGRLEGEGEYEMAGNDLEGTVVPGLSPGTMTYTENQTFTSTNTLEIEVDGTAPNTQHDVIDVVQTATISGTLAVTINYTPNIGDRIVFLTASTISGTFSTIDPALPLDWEIDYSVPGEVALEFGVSPLPVELIDFTARAINNEKVQLAWQTASEINNDYFEVQRSRDGIDFITIEEVSGAGSSDVIQYYQTEDQSPYDGLNYYRLKQVDFDGTFDYSEIKVVDISTMDIPLSVYPNPSSGDINFSEPLSGNLIVRNMLGQVVWQGVGEGLQNLDLSHLSAGKYILQHLNQENNIQTVKLTITKN